MHRRSMWHHLLLNAFLKVNNIFAIAIPHFAGVHTARQFVDGMVIHGNQVRIHHFFLFISLVVIANLSNQIIHINHSLLAHHVDDLVAASCCQLTAEDGNIVNLCSKVQPVRIQEQKSKKILNCHLTCASVLFSTLPPFLQRQCFLLTPPLSFALTSFGHLKNVD